MRRYSPAQNAIERIRSEFGLGELDDAERIPRGEGPRPGVHPLPMSPPALPRHESPSPLPLADGHPLQAFRQPFASGAVDYEARQRTQLEDLPRGGVVEATLVYPAWESRLVDMRDFLGVRSVEPAAPGTTTLSFPIPQGYTAFWKEFRYFFEPVPAGFSSTDVLVTLLVDDNVVPDYFNLPLGPLMAAFQKTFVIAAEGRVLQLRFTIALALPLGTDVTAFFYGNMRIRTGTQENREVGIKQPEPPPVIVQVPAPPPPREPPPTAPTFKPLHAARRRP